MNAVSAPLPLLPPEDQALLARYFAANEDLAALAREPGQPDLLSLLRWLSRPEIAAYITAFHTHQNHLHRQSIIDSLRTALASLTDPIEIRRAAATLIRALYPARTRQSPRPESPPSPHSPHSTAHPPRHRSHQSHVSHSPSDRGSPGSPARSAAPDSTNHRRPTSPTPATSPPRPATPSLPPPIAAPLAAPLVAPVTASPIHTPLDHSSALAQALAILGLPTDLEALDRLDDEEDDAADDAEIDAFADGEDEDDEGEQDETGDAENLPPHPTNSS